MGTDGTESVITVMVVDDHPITHLGCGRLLAELGYGRVLKAMTGAEALAAILEGAVKKGDVLATARIAGINGAKKTSELIPLCHQLALSSVKIAFGFTESSITIEAVFGRTSAANASGSDFSGRCWPLRPMMRIWVSTGTPSASGTCTAVNTANSTTGVTTLRHDRRGRAGCSSASTIGP